jgi:hypothetical protein
LERPGVSYLVTDRTGHKEVGMADQRQETQNEDHASAADRGHLAEQDLIITEDGEIIPRRSPPYVQGQVIFEEPSVG